MDSKELREYCELAGLGWDEEDEEWWYCFDGSKDRFPKHLPYDEWPEWRSMTEDNPALLSYVADILVGMVMQRGLVAINAYRDRMRTLYDRFALFVTAEARCRAAAAALKETQQ